MMSKFLTHLVNYERSESGNLELGEVIGHVHPDSGKRRLEWISRRKVEQRFDLSRQLLRRQYASVCGGHFKRLVSN